MITEREQDGIDDLAVKARAGDAEAFAELIRVFRPYVVGLVRKQTGWSYHDLDDLAQAAWEGVVDAIKRFDPKRGKFVTFAHHRMRMYLSNWMASNAGSVSLPYAAWRLARKIDDRLSEDGRELKEMSDDELEEVVGSYAPFAEHIMRARAGGYDLQPGDRVYEEDDEETDRDAAALEVLATIRGLPVTRRRAEALRFCSDWGLDDSVAERMVEATAEEASDVSTGD